MRNNTSGPVLKLLAILAFVSPSTNAQLIKGFRISAGPALAALPYDNIKIQGIEGFAAIAPGYRISVAFAGNSFLHSTAFLGYNYYRFTSVKQPETGYHTMELRREASVTSSYHAISGGYALVKGRKWNISSSIELAMMSHQLEIRSGEIPKDSAVLSPFQSDFRSRNNFGAGIGLGIDYRLGKPGPIIWTIGASLLYQRTIVSSAWKAYGTPRTAIGQSMRDLFALDISLRMSFGGAMRWLKDGE